MAVAEARAAWQRTANRCFVQEDAKRAPKLSCCPSSVASNAADRQGYAVPGFNPASTNPAYTYLSPNLRWWSQPQPNHGYKTSLTNERSIAMEAEVETLKGSFHGKSSRDHLNNSNGGKFVSENLEAVPSLDTQSRTIHIHKDHTVQMEERKNVHEPLKSKDEEESFQFIKVDHVCWEDLNDSFELCSELGSPWNEVERSDFWWQTADRDELASFVEQKSLDLIDNCDLPKSQYSHIKRAPYAHIGCSDYYWRHKDQTLHKSDMGNSGQSLGNNFAVEGNSESGRHKSISVTSNEGTAKMHMLEKDSSKAQLLEALRHSQTRAREAEKAAKQAYEEKEHIVKLFFKQASHLFAYKQWFKIQQLENICLEIKNKNCPHSNLLPVLLPWMPLKTKKVRTNFEKAWKRSKRNKLGCSRCNFRKYSLILLLWPILVGTGLFLGWTAGWMLLSV